MDVLSLSLNQVATTAAMRPPCCPSPDRRANTQRKKIAENKQIIFQKECNKSADLCISHYEDVLQNAWFQPAAVEKE